MSHARRARRVLVAMACTAAAASAGCRSPFHSFADAPRPGAPEAVATVDRKEAPELAPPAVAPEAARPAPAIVEAIEPAEPVATPLLDAALLRAEAAEASQREVIREAQAAIRRPVAEPPVAVAPEPAPAPAPTGIEITATVEPPGEPTPAPDAAEPSAEATVDQPRSDPAVLPAAALAEGAEAETPDEDAPPAELPEETPTRPTPPAPTTTEPEPTPEVPTLPEGLEEGDRGDEAGASGEPALTIEAVRLCRKIVDFGSYEPLKSSTLRPGQQALVYCELGGLEYRPEGDGFVAKVATRVELVRTDDGQKAWEVSDGAADRRPARRRDVYVGTMIKLPDSVPPGEYTLRLYQADSTTGRTASAEIPVTIAR